MNLLTLLEMAATGMPDRVAVGRTHPPGTRLHRTGPIAATGARMVVSMVHELARRGARIGVVAMCAGGGMGSALVLERL
jgi:acetyl-CoA acetyltransferase